MHIHLDCVGGIAGDMFLAACLDAWPEHRAGLERAIRQGGLPDDWEISIASGRSAGLAGTRFSIGPSSATAAARPTGLYRDIRTRVADAPLDEAVRDRALDIFARLAGAEAEVHGVGVDDVHFHELADWDSVADIVGAAWMIEEVGATSWSISPLPMGGGTVRTEHGVLPVPAPAVARLLTGFHLVDDGVAGERVTPTGAAIVAHLEPASTPAAGAPARTGHGLGTRQLPDRPNMVRLLALDAVAAPDWNVAPITVIELDIDDQSPEDLGVALDVLRTLDGVVDVVQGAVTGKKGRIAIHVRVLCRSADRDRVIAACFEQTTTIGLRWRDELRAELRRELDHRCGIAGKAVTRPGGVRTAKPEIDDVAALARTAAEREQARATYVLRPDEAGS